MEVNVAEFKEKLERVMPAVAQKAIVEESGHFVFHNNRVSAYNDLVCISEPLKTDFECTVPAKELLRIISKMTAETCQLVLDENELIVLTKRLKGTLAVTEGTTILKYIKDLQIPKRMKLEKTMPQGLMEGLKLCHFSASKDMSNLALTCLHVQGDKVTSCDDIRISQYTMHDEIETDSFLIPASSVSELIKFKPISFFVSPAWIYFFTKQRQVFVARRVAGDYPNFGPEFKFKGDTLELPKLTAYTVDAVSVLATGEYDIDKKVDVEISKGKIFIKSERENVGWLEGNLPISKKYRKMKLGFTINPAFFTEILKRTSEITVGKNKAMFKFSRFKHLVSLKLV